MLELEEFSELVEEQMGYIPGPTQDETLGLESQAISNRSGTSEVASCFGD